LRIRDRLLAIVIQSDRILKDTVDSLAYAQLSDVRAAAGNGILVAVDAGFVVIDWAKSVKDGLLRFKDGLVINKVVQARLNAIVFAVGK